MGTIKYLLTSLSFCTVVASCLLDHSVIANTASGTDEFYTCTIMGATNDCLYLNFASYQIAPIYNLGRFETYAACKVGCPY
ncbi:MAG: hypothetical protein Q7U04_09060 [Bacteriovorax sp.]|nr:hypothetical protein [Bacteriovorax sp.]